MDHGERASVERTWDVDRELSEWTMGHLCTIRANLGPRPHQEWVGWSTCAWPAAPRDLAQSFLPSLALTHEIMLATRKVFAPTTGANWVSGSERAQCGCGCCTSEICTRWHRRRSAHCMRTVPRGRVCQETEPGDDPRLSTTRFFCPTRTTFTTSHYLQLPLPPKLLSLALHSACQLDRGSVRHQLSRTRNGRQCVYAFSSTGSDLSVARVLGPHPRGIPPLQAWSR
jgi:hypothetical protein